MNPLDVEVQNGAAISNGNLEATLANATVKVTIGMPASGKWYFEVTAAFLHNGQYCGLHGLTKAGTSSRTGILLGTNNDAGYYKNGTLVQVVSGLTTNDVLGIAVNMDSLTLQGYKNGALWGSSISIDNATYIPIVGGNGNNLGDGSKCIANFGQRAFAYPLSGFKALCDTNLPSPLIAKPNTLMDVALYTGNGSTQTISGLNFSPDLVWIKARSAATAHLLFDQIRGATYYLSSNATDAESNIPSTTLTAFTSDGFTLGSNSSANGSSVTLAAWAWDAGTSTVSNTQGSITSQVRANVSAGFSIVSYTGTGSTGTLGHGLGVKPQLLIVKSRTQARDWLVYHTSYGATQYTTLNGTGAAAATTSAWNNTEPTSTVFTIGNAAEINTNGSTNIAYCFAPVVGYSSFGSYTGNGSASDGPFVYTGFRPKWILVKRTDSADDWPLMDTVRTPANPQNAQLWPNFSNAESSPVASSRQWDALSNGFKLRGDNGAINASAGTYIYIAFAENPFQYARAR